MRLSVSGSLCYSQSVFTETSPDSSVVNQTPDAKDTTHIDITTGKTHIRKHILNSGCLSKITNFFMSFLLFDPLSLSQFGCTAQTESLPLGRGCYTLS